MDDNIRITLIVTGILIALLPQLIFMIISEDIVGEQLCVDGNHNINLEGIMCEKTEQFVPGLSGAQQSTISIISIVIGILIYVIGLSARGENNDA